MPIVEVEIILRHAETLPNDLAQRLADRLGEIFASPPGSTWVKLRGLPREHYAENGGLDEELAPVFVSLVKAHLPSPDEQEHEVKAISLAVAELCGRPGKNVHVIYQLPGAGRVAFGGQLVR